MNKEELNNKHEHGCGCGHEHTHGHGGDDTKERRREFAKIAVAGVLFFAGWILSEKELISGWWLLIPYLIVAFDTLKEAVENIAHGRIFDEELLMAVASLGAIAAGEMHEACAVMLLFSLGEWFEDVAAGKTKNSIEELMDIRPDSATVLRTSGEVMAPAASQGKVMAPAALQKEQPAAGGKILFADAEYIPITAKPEDVKVGDVILVKPGERIALDGIILEGETTVDTAALTGESLPVEKTTAQRILSGSVNLTGTIFVRVEKPYAESTVSRILELVEHAEERKTKTENFITKFSHIYTPIVCGLALFLAIGMPLISVALAKQIMPLAAAAPLGFGTGIWRQWIYRALTFLVVSCPCALVVSVPLAFVGGIGAASRKGILVKGSNYLEMLAKTDVIYMDKTGTVTEGFFTVQEIEAAEHCCFEHTSGVQPHDHKDCLLHLAAAVETFSDHPVARSIVRAAEEHREHEKNCVQHGEACEMHGESHENPESAAVACAHGHHVEHMHFHCSADSFPEHCVLNVKEEGGKGISCICDGRPCFVGNGKLVEAAGLTNEPSFLAFRNKAVREPGTLVHVALGGLYMGYIRVGDGVKAETADALKALKKLGIRQVTMLTGDSKAAAQQVVQAITGGAAASYGTAAASGSTAITGGEASGSTAITGGEASGSTAITGGEASGSTAITGEEASASAALDFRANLLPEDKVRLVEESIEKGNITAFVGDGINDAPVLMRADVGIAMGAIGSDAAIESADIVIMDDKLAALPAAIRIARKSLRIANENIYFAIGVKVLILVLSAFGITGMWLAVFGDVGVLVLAIMNSARAMRA